MEDPRAQTLEALDEFIQTQRTLLARTQADIERLRVLKHDLVADPQTFVSHITEKLDDPAFRLSEGDCDYTLHIPSSQKSRLNWDAFTGHDPTPLRTLPSPSQAPPKKKPSPPSKLQLLVQSHRATIIDPTFLLYPPPAPAFPFPSPSPSTDLDPEVLKRNREHAKLRELKQLVQRGSAGGLKLPRALEGKGVFVRRGVEDESGEVDISLDIGMEVDDPPPAIPRREIKREVEAEEERASRRGRNPTHATKSIPMLLSQSQSNMDTSLSIHPDIHSDIHSDFTLNLPPDPPSPIQPKPPRSRRASRPKSPKPAPKPIPKRGRRANKKVRDEDDAYTNPTSDNDDPEYTPLALAPSSSSTPPPGGGSHAGKSVQAIKASTGKSGKPKPETYKQAWSVAEQHLLEQLLEEVPEGEKFRWQKISRAMGGRRTPRQVASRVQKYFEKLKRFGVG
ncbi:hypothetical protein D9611_011154 [Ephemerocybe angulata]|uniref:Myb-like domain-containing protein n=1 Tax=Ephemerocybe angulata TaxID=980116 RepID=A0A8H5FJ49_9AGAR|nr:hypothetical protein D9611_011154 [Tulosesus angulatus]